MILAAGLTPAWQQILLFDQVRIGQVNRARKAHWAASGKVLNVGLALSALGAECLTLSLLGGAPREEIQRQFREAGANAQWIESAHPTRVCTTILDRSSGQTTELVENAPPATPGELDAFRAAYSEAAAAAPCVVLTGSLPAETPASFYADLLDKTPGRSILDVRGDELLAALEKRPFLVKPNREELAKTLRRELNGDEALRQAMAELHRRARPGLSSRKAPATSGSARRKRPGGSRRRGRTWSTRLVAEIA